MHSLGLPAEARMIDVVMNAALSRFVPINQSEAELFNQARLQAVTERGSANRIRKRNR